MDEDKMSPAEAALLRARLHIRCGRRRLLEGKEEDGLATLYDALNHGLKYYALNRDLDVGEEDGGGLHHRVLAIARQLVQAGILDDLDFVTRCCSLADHAVEGKVLSINPGEFLHGLDEIMTRLGVMPFAEGELPPEDPATF